MARFILKDVILSYPTLFAPRLASNAKPGDTPKFSVTYIVTDGAQQKAFKKAALAVAQEKWGAKLAGAKLRTLETQYGPAIFLVSDDLRLKMPWNDDPSAVAGKGYPEGSMFINSRGGSKPGIVSTVPDPNTNKPMAITDEARVYPGVIANASGDLYTFDNSGNKGVSFGLGNVQIVRDGERLDSRKNAADEFDADANAVADLSDLTGEQPAAATAGASASDDLSDLIG